MLIERVGAVLRTAILLTVALPLAAAAQERLPDPTERTTMVAQRVGPPVAPRWILESTLVAQDRRIAVINGESVTVGDTVRGARVVRIESFGVRLRTADGMVELTLSGADPKQLAGGGTAR